MSGTSFGSSDQQSDVSEWVLEGAVGASYAGEYVWERPPGSTRPCRFGMTARSRLR